MLVLNNMTHDARVHKEAKTLALTGYEVTVAALWQAGLAEQESQAGYRVLRLRLRSRRWRGRLLAPLAKYLEYGFLVWRLAGREPAQVYHAHDANTLPAGWLASRRAGAHLVYDAHELETGRSFNSRLPGIYQRVWAWPERAFIRQADAVLTVSESVADELVRLYAIPRPTVVMNCPDWQAPRQSTRLRDVLSLPAHLKVAIYVGGVAAGRGLQAFLEAIQRLPDVAGVVLGDGPLLPALQAGVEAGQWQRVYLPGKVPLADVPDYIASADVGMVLIQDTCLSYRLSLPNKLFEYIGAGIPVVGSDLPEIARVIREQGVGQVVNPEDPQAIADGMSSLLHRPEAYTQAKANAARAATLFNWQQESAKLLALYRHIEGRSP